MRFTEEYLFDQGVVPRWYGLSYRVDYMFVSVFYPIPFNLIVRWVRNIWLDVSSINPAYMKEHLWYKQGYAAGAKIRRTEVLERRVKGLEKELDDAEGAIKFLYNSMDDKLKEVVKIVVERKK